MLSKTILAVLGLQGALSPVFGKLTPKASPKDDVAALDDIAEIAKLALEKTEDAVSGESIESRSGCHLFNMRIRREWGSLSRRERLEYIDAVKCLQSKPSRYPDEEAPGAKSRFDDFIAVHIKQTLEIHYTENFLSWHRYFTWAYETALRDECGYTGAQPYWNWGLTAITGMHKSPIFDGSDTSLSGDGAPVPDKPDHILLGGPQDDMPPVLLPVGAGGGCVTSGPFQNMTVNLGPVALDLPGGLVGANPAGPLAHNPRCLKRDLTDAINRDFASAGATLRNIVEPRSVMAFQMQMQGVVGSGNIGIHGGGHYALGGDPGRDVFVSPGDPAFYLHHAMIDRVWWMWQMLDPAARVRSDAAIDGTRTFLDQPPSANATLDDVLDLEAAFGPPQRIRDVMSTVRGPLCYAYL